MALGLTGGSPPPEQGRQAGAGISEQGVTADDAAQFGFSTVEIGQLEGRQGGAGAGHGEPRTRLGRSHKAGAGSLPIAAGALHIAQVVEGRGVGEPAGHGIAIKDPAVIGFGGIPLLQGLLSGAAVEMGIGVLWIQLHRPALIGDGGLGIPKGQLHVAAVAPGGGILRRQLQNTIPQGQGSSEVAVAAGNQGALEQLRQGWLRPGRSRCGHSCRSRRQQQGQGQQRRQQPGQQRGE